MKDINVNLLQTEQQEREMQLSDLSNRIRRMLQEKKGLETRNKNLYQELDAQHYHLEEIRSHKVTMFQSSVEIFLSADECRARTEALHLPATWYQLHTLQRITPQLHFSFMNRISRIFSRITRWHS